MAILIVQKLLNQFVHSNEGACPAHPSTAVDHYGHLRECAEVSGLMNQVSQGLGVFGIPFLNLQLYYIFLPLSLFWNLQGSVQKYSVKIFIWFYKPYLLTKVEWVHVERCWMLILFPRRNMPVSSSGQYCFSFLLVDSSIPRSITMMLTWCNQICNLLVQMK